MLTLTRTTRFVILVQLRWPLRHPLLRNSLILLIIMIRGGDNNCHENLNLQITEFSGLDGTLQPRGVVWPPTKIFRLRGMMGLKIT